MPPSSAELRYMVGSFKSYTGASDRVANKYIKSAGYKVNEAVDEYFHDLEAANGSSGPSAPAGPSGIAFELNSLFDNNNNDAKDQMELNSTMDYLSKELKVNIENAELFVALELLQAPTVGEISRKGYVEGWQKADVSASHKDHAKYIRKLTKALPKDAALFKKVYKYAFVAGREKDQKALSTENALIYWDMLFASPGMEWKNEQRDWLPLWKAFLAEKWTRSVNRDMWNMALEFALKSMADDSLSFWNEHGAWPSVIDDFVAWYKANGVGKSEHMEVDDA